MWHFSCCIINWLFWQTRDLRVYTISNTYTCSSNNGASDLHAHTTHIYNYGLTLRSQSGRLQLTQSVERDM